MLAILTYHSVNILGNDYPSNDHVALAEDLRRLTAAGVRIRPLGAALDALWNGELDQPTAAITFDDGAMFDAVDFEHPTCGFQKSFLRLMTEFRDAHPQAQPELHATAFVIVSPEARRQIDEIDFGSRGWWHDDWWQVAAASGLMNIENHSWDHNHPSLPVTVQKHNQRGDFWCIDTCGEADLEIRQAARFLRARGIDSRYFAYPWGQVNAYLSSEYLPRFGPDIGLSAAFSTDPAPVTPDADRWNLPRYVCGRDWSNPEQLVALFQRQA